MILLALMATDQTFFVDKIYILMHMLKERFAMATLLTRNIASMTEMREPHKVLEKSGGEPVAVLRN